MNLFAPLARPTTDPNAPQPAGLEAVAARGFVALLAAVGGGCDCQACVQLREIASSLQTSLSATPGIIPSAGGATSPAEPGPPAQG